jgi:selenium metabolism protein YedF
MINQIDCRGMNCPEPVLQVRNAIEKELGTSISVLVDNEAAQQNVIRFLNHQNYLVSSEKSGSDFQITGIKSKSNNMPVEVHLEAAVKERQPGMKKIMILVTSAFMGHGDDGLGDMLMFNFLKTLKEMGPELWRVSFINNGVSFTAEGSEAVPILQELAASGVQISACGACLAYFHILDKIQVGEVTNMLEIVTGMKLADTVVTI